MYGEISDKIIWEWKKAHLDAFGRVGEKVCVALHIVRVVLPRPLRAPRDGVAAGAKQR